ncbi:hypothetical protein M0R45_023748 [Rubus argutus]|uniref:FBD domain-containing protein n=1 Tax=Rubus argutus TaxID=59490 RepID=A0AAW1WP85_RUBAR
MELDKISNLPSGITENFFSYFSIKEAARTSVLSKDWRHRWTTLPFLVFDDKIDHLTEAIVSHVLLSHSGPIHTFKLSSRKYLFQFVCLSRIDSFRAANCLLNPPSTIKGFRMLKSLHIRRVTVTRNVLEEMIFCCPRLESIIICHLLGATHLKIDAPNLRFLKVEGGLEDVQLESARNLVDVSIDRKRGSTNSSKLLRFFFKLPRIERLTLGDSFLECAIDSLPEKLAKPCLCLNFLSISIRLNNLEEILTAMCLLRSAPALQELKFLVRQEDRANAGGAASWVNDNQNRAFTQLRIVKVIGLSGVKAELDFLKFLLLSSPALQELEISFGREDVQVLDYFSWLHDNPNNGAFTQLRLVKVTGLSGNKSQVDFIRFLLSSTSPMLERMTLQPASARVSWELFKLLAEFKRNSVPAYLEFLNPSIPMRDFDD